MSLNEEILRFDTEFQKQPSVRFADIEHAMIALFVGLAVAGAFVILGDVYTYDILNANAGVRGFIA